jgi:hypothetical protein
MDRDPEQEERIRGGSVGDRVRYWRQVRGYNTVPELARALREPETTLYSLENNQTKKGKLLPEIASLLRISYQYLLTGKGDPEVTSGFTQEPVPTAPVTEQWPLPNIPRAYLSDLDEVELGFIESQLTLILDKVRARRRSRQRS